MSARHSEPDVGKSALAVADELVSENGVVHVLNLRDLPTQTLELEHLIGGPIGDVLAAGPVSETLLLLVDGAEAVLEAWSAVFSDLSASAFAAGIAVVAVERGDAARVCFGLPMPSGNSIDNGNASLAVLPIARGALPEPTRPSSPCCGSYQ